MSWGEAERARALGAAAEQTWDLLVIGGGITGAGVLRDAALRGLSALLIERDDFASGTSSATSKMIHGGLRYLREGQPGTTLESCRERDRLAALDPNLVQPFTFLIPAYEGRMPPWMVKAALSIYTVLGGFRPTSRHRMIGRAEVSRYSRDLATEGLRGAGIFTDRQVDDARFVLELIYGARRAGAEALSFVEAERLLDEGGRVAGARVRDARSGATFDLRARAVVNAAGPAADRLLSSHGRARPLGIRPAKGAHVVLSVDRLHAEAAIGFQAQDGRSVFVCPWQGVILVGTTDTFTDRVDEPAVTKDDAEYLLDAVNRAFPRADLSLDDVLSVYVGVRPLVADEDDPRPPSSISRKDEVLAGPEGLLTVAGGKLTTHRAMAEKVVDRVVAALPPERRRGLAPCQTKLQPVRGDRFDRGEMLDELGAMGLSGDVAAGLIERWGEDAHRLVDRAPEDRRETIGRSRYLYAELPWAVERECALRLTDLLERRFRLAVCCPGQGLDQLDRIGDVVADAAGWDDARTAEEKAAYRQVVGRRYRVV